MALYDVDSGKFQILASYSRPFSPYSAADSGVALSPSGAHFAVLAAPRSPSLPSELLFVSASPPFGLLASLLPRDAGWIATAGAFANDTHFLVLGASSVYAPMELLWVDLSRPSAPRWGAQVPFPFTTDFGSPLVALPSGFAVAAFASPMAPGVLVRLDAAARNATQAPLGRFAFPAGLAAETGPGALYAVALDGKSKLSNVLVRFDAETMEGKLVGALPGLDGMALVADAGGSVAGGALRLQCFALQRPDERYVLEIPLQDPSSAKVIKSQIPHDFHLIGGIFK